jgi:hypothetical protein
MAKKNQRQHDPRGKVAAAAGLALGGVAILLVVQLVQGPPDSTTLILVAFAALLLFIWLAPGETSRFFQRMSNLKVAGVLEIGMQTVARAEELKPPPVGDEPRPPDREGRGLTEIVAEVKRRLRFVHAIVHMHTDPRPQRSEWQIALWLSVEGLLNENESRFVLDLLSNRELGVDALPDREREELLDAAWTFAARFGFTVWDRHVRQELQKAGWVVADFPQPLDHQADFLAHRDGKWAAIATKVGEKGGYRYGTTRRRLEGTDANVELDGWLIVFPGGDRKASVVSKEKGSGGDSKVKVLELKHLLEKPERAFAGNDWNDDSERPCARD